MDYNEIKKIIKDMEECSLEELDIEFTDGTKIKMKKHCEPKGAPMMPPMGFMGQMPVMGQPVINNNIPELKKTDLSASAKEEENYKLVKSPMVGTFYSKPSPKAEPLVKVGDKVIYSKYAGTDVELEGEKYIIVKQNDILAIVE